MRYNVNLRGRDINNDKYCTHLQKVNNIYIYCKYAQYLSLFVCLQCKFHYKYNINI